MVLLTALFTASLSSQQVTGRFGTAVYGWKMFDSSHAAQTIARAYETFQLAVTRGNVTVQTAGIGEMNLNSPFGDLGDVRVSNLFLRWKNVIRTIDLSLGRIPVFAGVGNGIVDGAMLKIRPGLRWNGTVYGGANVLQNLTGIQSANQLDGNYFFGGEMGGAVGWETRFTLSYMNRRMSVPEYYGVRPDSVFNPIRVLLSPEPRSEQYASADVRYEPWENGSLTGRYDYDLNFKRSLRAELFARVPVTGVLALTGNYIYREPWLQYHTFFDVFPVTSVSEYEGGLEFAFMPSLWIFGRFAYVRYTDDNAKRYTVGFNSFYCGASYAGSAGYAGDLNGLNLRMRYPLCDRKFIPSVQLAYSSYKLSPYDSLQSVFSIAGGVQYSPIPDIALNVQLQWLNNPLYAHDVRIFGMIDYWFSRHFPFPGGEGGSHE